MIVSAVTGNPWSEGFAIIKKKRAIMDIDKKLIRVEIRRVK
jgi:hypothetical protein